MKSSQKYGDLGQWVGEPGFLSLRENEDEEVRIKVSDK